MDKRLGIGKKIRARDTFTLFTGIWGHEEFEQDKHQLIAIKFGDISADYEERSPDPIVFLAREFGLAMNQNGAIRDKRERTFRSPVLAFDKTVRPRLRKLYKYMLTKVRGPGRKKLVSGRISWNILSFTTIGPNGDRCQWERANLGSNKDPVFVPLLIRVNRIWTCDMSLKQQSTAVGDDFFGGVCKLEYEQISKLSCAGI